MAEKISSTIGARGSRWMKASLLCLQGMCALTGSGDFGKAERFLTEAASLAKQDTMQLLLIMILNALTSAQIAQGRLQAAYQTTLKGYDIIQSRSLPAETVQARLLVSRVAHLLGNLEEALQQLDETLELIANTSYLGSGEGETEAVIEKGGLLSALGLHEEAEGCLRQGYAQAGKNHSTKQVMHAISHLVRNFSRQGDAESPFSKPNCLGKRTNSAKWPFASSGLR